jgi:hypothetical protein
LKVFVAGLTVASVKEFFKAGFAALKALSDLPLFYGINRISPIFTQL